MVDWITETYEVKSTQDVAEWVSAARQDDVAIFPIGGKTSLDYGLKPSRVGWGLELSGMDQVIDYPAADMTISVQAGIRMSTLDDVLAEHGQQLPLDAPLARDATLGGVLATNFSGPRRLGYGTARDYVIGIRAVDGTATTFAGGGRVVKNVAGYDFCKLLVGSLGTLGVITEVTLKLKPRPACRAAVIAAPHSASDLSDLFAKLVHSEVRPVAAEWVGGPEWEDLGRDKSWPTSTPEVGWVMVVLEGTEPEIRWMVAQLESEWKATSEIQVLHEEPSVADLLGHLVEFPASGEPALALKASIRPSHVFDMVREVREIAPDTSFQVHAGNGIMRAKLPEFPPSGLSQTVTSRWQPAAHRYGGHMTLLSNPSGQELTRRAMWGDTSGPLELERQIKREFDPQDLLNPGRFVY